MLYSAKTLKETIQELYGVCEDARESVIEDMLDSLDFDALAQGIRDQARTVYTYIAQGRGKKREKSFFSYRGRELFEQRATLLYTGNLYEDFEPNIAGTVSVSRNCELWLLEDMSIAVVVCVTISYSGGAYATEYREIKGLDPQDMGMSLDPADLTGALEELCYPSFSGSQPFYETVSAGRRSVKW